MSGPYWLPVDTLGADPRRFPIPTDSLTLIGLGVAAIVVVWLAFSILKKVIGFAVLAVVIIGAVVIWNDPALMNQITGEASKLMASWF